MSKMRSVLDKLWIAVPIAFFAASAFLITCNGCSPKPLAHRPINELTNWGQGRAPSIDRCPPGTIRFETDDGLFLECFRGTSK